MCVASKNHALDNSYIDAPSSNFAGSLWCGEQMSGKEETSSELSTRKVHSIDSTKENVFALP